MNTQSIEIALDRKKLKRIFVTLIAFIIFGTLGFVFSLKLESEFWAEVIGTIALVMFSLGIGLFFVYLAEAKKKGPGLIINAEGITENANVDCVGFVPWSHITGFKEARELNQKYIGVLVNNPIEYINRKSLFLRGAVQNSYKIKGFVFSIPSNRLQMPHEELKTLLEQKMAEYKK